MTQPVAEKRNRGSVALLIAVAAVALLGFAALAIDIGYGLATRAQLQNVADSGSFAGNRELATIYGEKGNLDYTKYTLTSVDKARLLARINEYTLQNKAAAKPIAVSPSDVQYGVWNSATRTMTPASMGVDSISVTARRDDQGNGTVATLLAQVLGVQSFSIKAASAVNAVSGLKSMPAGKGDVPFGIAKYWFTAHDSPCSSSSAIKFHPTGNLAGCAGWHVFTDSPSSASKLRSIIQGLQAGTFVTPETIADETYYNFTGGTVASAYPYFVDLYNSKKGPDGTWLVHIPVYDKDDCSNPHATLKIIGFATARIYSVTTSPSNTISANVECSIVPWGQADGPSKYGTSVQTVRVVK
ncbi:MAG: Tad domain-containing protein [Deltaproteobacteria bacterium]|nr:Tad domain-containing protein [Deltaproteobacteria bacterium]